MATIGAATFSFFFLGGQEKRKMSQEAVVLRKIADARLVETRPGHARVDQVSSQVDALCDAFEAAAMEGDFASLRPQSFIPLAEAAVEDGHFGTARRAVTAFFAQNPPPSQVRCRLGGPTVAARPVSPLPISYSCVSWLAAGTGLPFSRTVLCPCSLGASLVRQRGGRAAKRRFVAGMHPICHVCVPSRIARRADEPCGRTV